MPLPNTNAALTPLTREQQIRRAILLSFCNPVPEQCECLLRLSEREWGKLLRWLDVSGLALYFLDRMVELRMDCLMPPAVIARLRQNLADNTERTRGMIAESEAIQKDFQRAGLAYAVLKGFSLWPNSVPKPELRSQLDLDFLVARQSIAASRKILERRGYYLYSAHGRSWDFKTPYLNGNSFKGSYSYRDVPSRSVELHAEASNEGHRSLLSYTRNQSFHGMKMPVLSPADLFLGHGMHVYQHLCSEFLRAAHLLEFRRHVLTRYRDDSFWTEIRSDAEKTPRISVSLGVITLLVTQITGDFAPESFTVWTQDRLPLSARLWVEMYGPRTVFADFPGTKLYLLLERELESAGVPAKRSLKRALIPLHLPMAISHTTADETFRVRMQRYSSQSRFFLFRLRLHLREGIRYTWESRRWSRQMKRLVREGARPLDSTYPSTNIL